jgi:hypothetical protein
MSKIKAVLTRNISYLDFSGKRIPVPSGTPIDVLLIQSDTPFISTTGETGAMPPGTILATAGGDTFEIGRREFKTID